MNVEALRGVLEGKSKPCRKGDKRAKCRKRKRRLSYYSPFAILFPSKMGTPRSYTPGSANGDSGNGGGNGGNGGGMGGAGGGGMGNGGGGAAGGGGMAAAKEAIQVRPSRARVFHEMKKSMGLVEYFAPNNWGGTPHGTSVNPSWGGYSIPQLGMVKMRQGGPTIGGPGFQNNVDGERDGEGGRYDYLNSPGLGFRTEAGWRIWRAALEVMQRDARGTKQQIMMKALERAGVFRGQVDTSEMRLVEMGIEWYLSDTGALAAKRDGSSPPGSGGHTDAGRTLPGRGAP